MRAVVLEKYGPPEVLQLQEVEKPVPMEDEVLVKVLAASVNPADLSMRGGLARLMGAGLLKPKNTRAGGDIAGRVEAVGRNVTQFHPGDEVFGRCAGGFAEFAIAREKNIALKPANSSFEAAAAVPVAGITALQGLRDKGQIQAGQKVLINGASGGVGPFAVQIAKSFGAEVTAVCSPANLEMTRSLGADHVVDYTQEDITQSGQQFDLILAGNGYHSIFAYRRILAPHGIFLMVGASKDHLMQALLQTLLFGPLLSRKGGQKMGFMGIASMKREDLTFLKELIEAGKVVPVIDRSYPLGEIVAALQYLDTGHARAKVVITF